MIQGDHQTTALKGCPQEELITEPTLDVTAAFDHNYGGVSRMKTKYQVVSQTPITKKPAKVEVSDAEFRRRLKNISEWRKKRLAQSAMNS